MDNLQLTGANSIKYYLPLVLHVVLRDSLLMKSQNVTILMNVNEQYIYEALVLFSIFCKVKAIFEFRHKTDLRIYHHEITQSDNREIKKYATSKQRTTEMTTWLCVPYICRSLFSVPQ